MPTGRVGLDTNSLAQLSIPVALEMFFGFSNSPSKEVTNYNYSTVKKRIKSMNYLMLLLNPFKGLSLSNEECFENTIGFKMYLP